MLSISPYSAFVAVLIMRKRESFRFAATHDKNPPLEPCWINSVRQPQLSLDCDGITALQHARPIRKQPHGHARSCKTMATHRAAIATIASKRGGHVRCTPDRCTKPHASSLPHGQNPLPA
jgi:hypothetical protein